MALDPVANFAKVTVTTGYSAAATTVVLSTGDGAKLPQPSSAGSFNLVWWNATDYGDPADDPNVEIVRCTARTDDTLTITRAQESTSASTKNTAGKTYKMILAVTKKMMDDIAGVSLKFIQVTGAIPGTSLTAASTFSGKSVIVQNNTFFFQDIDYTVSGTTITWLYTLPEGYTSPMTLICVG